ncbi:MAG: hypothetical protein ACXWJ2_04125 [Hyphomicrobium sp.]
MPDTTAPVLTPTDARQASPRRLNLHVLIWSMILAVVAAAILYYGVYAKPDSSIGLPREQPASSAPPPATTAPAAPEATPATPPPTNP